MSKEFEFYHGMALCRIIHSESVTSIQLYPSKSNSSYVINNHVGLFIKYSTKRMSPWRFTFRREHQDEIYEMKQSLERVYVALVCRDDGVACLDYEELKLILDETHEEWEWVSAARRPREKYKIRGHDGKLKFKIADSHFPGKMFATSLVAPSLRDNPTTVLT